MYQLLEKAHNSQLCSDRVLHHTSRYWHMFPRDLRDLISEQECLIEPGREYFEKKALLKKSKN